MKLNQCTWTCDLPLWFIYYSIQLYCLVWRKTELTERLKRANNTYFGTVYSIKIRSHPAALVATASFIQRLFIQLPSIHCTDKKTLMILTKKPEGLKAVEGEDHCFSLIHSAQNNFRIHLLRNRMKILQICEASCIYSNLLTDQFNPSISYSLINHYTLELTFGFAFIHVFIIHCFRRPIDLLFTLGFPQN